MCLLSNMDVFIEHTNINEHQSAFIMTCVRTINACCLWTANLIDLKMPHEIVSLVGPYDSKEYRTRRSFSDEIGRILGGHIMDDHPMIIFATVELALTAFKNIILSREMNDGTGYSELVFSKRTLNT